MNYPPYACQCCGVTNGDMFYDYFASQDKEPTEADAAAFEGYRKGWWMLQEQRNQLRQEAIAMRLSGFRRHSEATRKAISRTKKAQNLKGRIKG